MLLSRHKGETYPQAPVGPVSAAAVCAAIGVIGTHHHVESGGIVFALLLAALRQEVVELERVFVPLDGVYVLSLRVVPALERHRLAEHHRLRNLNLRDADAENDWNGTRRPRSRGASVLRPKVDRCDQYPGFELLAKCGSHQSRKPGEPALA